MDEIMAGRYTLQQSIGKGASGEVFQGLDLETGRPVAIKVLRSDVVAQQPEMIARFIREGQLLRDLNHPNIVRYLDAETSNGKHYLVMEYVPGGSLKDYLQQYGPLPMDDTLRIGLELADALTRAHHLDIIHRDLKPDNVLLVEDGTPRLSDFGLARPIQKHSISASHQILGTPHYISPEMLQGEDIDARADIWAFGVMLYEMLTGIRPFRGDNMAALLTCILTTPPQPELDILRPDVPIALVDLVYRMLAKHRAERIPSCRHVGVELWNIVQGVAPQAISQRVDEGTFSLPRGPFTPRRTNLPAEMTPFVGRQHELSLMTKLMADPDRRLVTIKGPGGMGKTRLALEIARQRVEQFANGAFFVELAPLTNTVEIIPTIASAVDLPFAPGVDARDHLLNFFREKQVLLVMDNFEHLLDGTSLVTDILAAAPGVMIVATSREKLNLRGETVFDLTGLDVPASDDPDAIRASTAVQLFEQTACRLQPTFELQPDDLPAAAEICHLVQGMPLGIILATSWIQVLNVPDIADELRLSFDVLESDESNVPDRHRSIRVVFDHTWQRLSDAERDVFMKLSVFQGGFTRDAAQHIADASLRVLLTLMNKSLLERNPEGRFFIHELLRQYADEQLQAHSDIYRMTRDLHGDHYLGYVAQHGFHILVDYYETTLTDLDNIQVAWQWAVAQGGWELVEACMVPLTEFYEMHARFHEAETALNLVMEALDQQSDPRHAILGLAVGMRGFEKCQYGDDEAGATLMRQGVALLRQTEPGDALAWMLMQLVAARVVSEMAEREQLLQESLEISSRNGHRFNLASAIFYQGVHIHRPKGDIVRARQRLLEALSIFQQQEYQFAAGIVLNFLGRLEHQAGNYREAVEYYTQALDIWPSVRTWPYARSLLHLAAAEAKLDRQDAAHRHFQESIMIHEEMGWNQFVAYTCTVYGLSLWRWGDHGQARPLLRRALDIMRETGNLLDVANALVNLGHPMVSLGHDQEGWDYYTEALRLAQSQDNPFARAVLAEAVMGLARIIGKMDDPQQAVAYLSLATQVVSGDARLQRELQETVIQFLAPLEAALAPDDYAAAVKRGQGLDLDEAVADLLAMEF